MGSNAFQLLSLKDIILMDLAMLVYLFYLVTNNFIIFENQLIYKKTISIN